MRIPRAQSATEYLLTYSWAFLIAAVVIAALYFFVFAPAGITPTTCTFSSGTYCHDLVLGSSASLSKMAMLLSNTNPFPIISPEITVNITGIAPIQGTCVPYFVLPGGSIICNATITPAIPQSALAAGRFTVSYIPCPGGNVSLCSSNQRQSFLGAFNTHSSPLLSPITVNIILSAQNSSQIALSSVKDKLTANVKLLGTDLSGATVNFTTNSLNAVLSSSVSTTDGRGNAVSYLSDPVAENVLVSAFFSNSTSNTIVQFLPAVCFTFSLGSSSPSANALTLDGVGYSTFPQNLCYAQGSSHSYSFASTVAGSAGIQYVFNSASGCGASGQSGTILASANCTLTGTYTTQYLLTTSSSPPSGGTVTPSTQYYNSGTPVTLGETPNGGYFFLSWTGSGTGSYSGNIAAPTIGINGVITQQANFYSTSTSTTTSTSTSTTTTTVYPITYNPTSGTYNGDIIYTSSTSLTGNIIASNMVEINSGVTVYENLHYLQANALFYNIGTVTDSLAGGSAGSGGNPGAAGGSGISMPSAYFTYTLVGGKGGAGGGNGGGGGGVGSVADAGSGGIGGGIVQIYAGSFDNAGIVTVVGAPGVAGGAGGYCACYCSSQPGGGGGGQGGSGGTILIGYTTLIASGTLTAAGGAPGSGGASGSGYNPGTCCTSVGGAGGSNGGGGGSSGISFDSRCSQGPPYPNGGAAGGNSNGAASSAGNVIETGGWTHS